MKKIIYLLSVALMCGCTKNTVTPIVVKECSPVIEECTEECHYIDIRFGDNFNIGMTTISFASKLKDSDICELFYYANLAMCDYMLSNDEDGKLGYELACNENVFTRVECDCGYVQVWLKRSKDEFKYMYETKLKKYLNDFTSKHHLHITNITTVWEDDEEDEKNREKSLLEWQAQSENHKSELYQRMIERESMKCKKDIKK